MSEVIEALIKADQQLFLILNDWHHPVVDPVMYLISSKLLWIPFYLLIAGFLFRQYGKKALLVLVMIGMAAIASDQFTSSYMKPEFARYRPCHEPQIKDQVHTVEGCGGKFGFASSHAANTFSLAAFLFFLFRRKYPLVWLMFVWSFLVSFSRIYLGVHYPADILVGALVGIIMATIFYIISKKIIRF